MTTARHCCTFMFVVLGLPILYALDPIKRYRFGLLFQNRIGHLAGNTEFLFRRWQLDDQTVRERVVLAAWNPANHQLLKMQARTSCVTKSHLLTWVINACRPILEKTRFFYSTQWSDRDYREFNLGKPALSFTPEEVERGQNALRDMGIGADDWYVCLHARDSEYLETVRPDLKPLWDTRNFRNCRIENYLDAAAYITSRGGYVLRMGSIVENPLPKTENTRIIDYATRFQSDFMDIYLPATCRFFLGNSSGLFVVSTIFDRPVVLANLWSLASIPFRKQDLFIPKLVRHKTSGQVFSLHDAMQRGFYHFENGIGASGELELIENSPEDILLVTREMVDRLENRASDPSAEALQRTYKQRFMSQYSDYQLAGDISGQLLKKYPFLMEDGGTTGEHA